MHWLRGVAVMVFAVGCNFDSSAVGSGGPATPGDGTGPATGSGTLDGDDTLTPSTTQGPATTTEAPVDDSTTGTGPAAETGPPASARIEISDGPSYDFGPRQLGAADDHPFTITNEGDVEATGILVALDQPGTTAGAFDLAMTDCGDVLPAGESCTARVGLEPTLFGPHTADLRVEYVGEAGGSTTTVTRAIEALGVGRTGNLLSNGDGETGMVGQSPPPDWTSSAGQWEIGTGGGVMAHGGMRYVWAGDEQFGVSLYTAFQQRNVAGLTTWGDAEGLELHYRIFLRTYAADNDPSWITLRFRDFGGSPLGEIATDAYTGTAWIEQAGMESAPADTHQVQLVLNCQLVMGTTCSGYFDDMELWAEWNG